WGGLGAPTPQPFASQLVQPSRAMALGAALCFLGLAFAPQTAAAARWLLDVQGPGADEPPGPGWGSGAWLVLGVGVVWHGFLLVAAGGPLIQTDSWVNLFEPDLLHPWPDPYHHPPLYSGVVKVFGRGPHFLLGLWALVALQHALVLGMGLTAEASVRRTSGSAAGGACAGLLIVLCGHLALYAQMVMSEVVSTAWVVLALALVCEAARRARGGPWLLVGGCAAAAGTLTRQAMQGWFVVGLLAVLCLRFGRWQRAVALFLLGAAAPVLAMVAHNAVFHGRASLTAAVGRNLYYRLTPGMPDLTDPDAAPGDPYERARALIWERREGTKGYSEAYAAIQGELGWTDAQTEAAMKRFYLEQALRHPRAFAGVTLGFAWELIRAQENPYSVLQHHNQVLPRVPEVWADLPQAELRTPLAARGFAFQPTSLWPCLLLAAVAPLLVGGRARVLALAALASAAYFVTITALVELPLPRYRLPGIPFLAIACGLSVSGVCERARRWRARSPEEAA
ncbi:MAG: hypothetical protein KDD82_23675, partial [Planctomycetes bacterium]|nr:hypothetical protein [Planctomycetota bacterium]